MTRLIDSIPDDTREVIETYLYEDLLGAAVLDSVPIVDIDGEIFFTEIILRLVDGRKVAIVPQTRGNYSWLSIRIHDGQDWRRMTVFEDYSKELRDNKKIEF